MKKKKILVLGLSNQGPISPTILVMPNNILDADIFNNEDDDTSAELQIDSRNNVYPFEQFRSIYGSPLVNLNYINNPLTGPILRKLHDKSIIKFLTQAEMLYNNSEVIRKDDLEFHVMRVSSFESMKSSATAVSSSYTTTGTAYDIGGQISFNCTASHIGDEYNHFMIKIYKDNNKIKLSIKYIPPATETLSLNKFDDPILDEEYTAIIEKYNITNVCNVINYSPYGAYIVATPNIQIIKEENIINDNLGMYVLPDIFSSYRLVNKNYISCKIQAKGFIDIDNPLMFLGDAYKDPRNVKIQATLKTRHICVNGKLDQYVEYSATTQKTNTVTITAQKDNTINIDISKFPNVKLDKIPDNDFWFDIDIPLLLNELGLENNSHYELSESRKFIRFPYTDLTKYSYDITITYDKSFDANYISNGIVGKGHITDITNFNDFLDQIETGFDQYKDLMTHHISLYNLIEKVINKKIVLTDELKVFIKIEFIKAYNELLQREDFINLGFSYTQEIKNKLAVAIPLTTWNCREINILLLEHNNNSTVKFIFDKLSEFVSQPRLNLGFIINDYDAKLENVTITITKISAINNVIFNPPNMIDYITLTNGIDNYNMNDILYHQRIMDTMGDHNIELYMLEHKITDFYMIGANLNNDTQIIKDVVVHKTLDYYPIKYDDISYFYRDDEKNVLSVPEIVEVDSLLMDKNNVVYSSENIIRFKDNNGFFIKHQNSVIEDFEDRFGEFPFPLKISSSYLKQANHEVDYGYILKKIFTNIHMSEFKIEEIVATELRIGIAPVYEEHNSADTNESINHKEIINLCSHPLLNSTVSNITPSFAINTRINISYDDIYDSKDYIDPCLLTMLSEIINLKKLIPKRSLNISTEFNKRVYSIVTIFPNNSALIELDKLHIESFRSSGHSENTVCVVSKNLTRSPVLMYNKYKSIVLDIKRKSYDIMAMYADVLIQNKGKPIVDDILEIIELYYGDVISHLSAEEPVIIEDKFSVNVTLLFEMNSYEVLIPLTF